MVNNIREPSQKHILRIAKKHFLAFGYAGARMQAIADETKVNKALLHYYYKNKVGLFKKVFDEESSLMIASAEQIVTQPLPILIKLRKLIENDISHLLKNQAMPMFMMRELARDPDLISKFDPGKKAEQIMQILAKEIHLAQTKKILRSDISVQDIFVNMSALAMFPFLAKPFCMNTVNMKEKEYNLWLIERKKTAADFILAGIKK